MARRLPLTSTSTDPLVPDPHHIEQAEIAELIAAEPRSPAPGRPWVTVNMVASVDGATEVDGVSGSLGSAVDSQVLAALRGIADIVLVGSGTVSAERYGPVRLPEAAQQARPGRGQSPAPRIAVVSRSGSIDLELPLFSRASDPSHRPIVMVAADTVVAERRNAIDQVAEVVEVPPSGAAGGFDIADAIHLLGSQFGATNIVCEGGPTLNGLLIATDLVDEWCLTLAPLLVGGASKRAALGPTVSPTLRLGLDRVWHHDGELLLRFLRTRSG